VDCAKTEYVFSDVTKNVFRKLMKLFT